MGLSHGGPDSKNIMTSFDNPSTVRIATWNLLHTAVHNYEERLLEAVAQIKQINPDVLLVQEALFQKDRHDAILSISQECHLAIASRAEMIETHKKPASPNGVGLQVHVGVLTRFPVLENNSVPLEATPLSEPEAALSVMRQPSGNLLIACSAHLAWGGAAESYRYAQARQIDAAITEASKSYIAAGENIVAVVGGDFNAVPESRTLRWLRGLDPGPGKHDTYWVDAWIAGGGEGAGFTSRPDNPHAHHTARRVGISRPERNPYRRIDYILVRDWVHGRPGDPLRAGTFGEEPLTGVFASDHLGVWADLVDEPPLTPTAIDAVE